MKHRAVLLAVLLCGFALSRSVPAQTGHPAAQPGKPATLIPGLGDHHHPVSTRNPEAQKFFDQGLILLYAFNHDEAARSFARATELDPELAMAYWGLALVKGPNYNLDADDAQWKDAYAALKKALDLSEQASEPERDYIQALAKRYARDPKSDRSKLAFAYKEAMGAVSKKYPDDLDAATLYAESAMNLRPWKLWSPDGKPAEGTEEILAVLESVLSRNPRHPGANHYFIHAIEASPHPERGLPCAQRLETLVPAAGHLVHMPSHIYIRIGDYAAAAKTNEQAILADEKYIKTYSPTGAYPMMYFPHNIHFASVAHCIQGRFADAKKMADYLAAQVGPHLKEMPMLEGFLVVPPQVLARFQRWDEILTSKMPPAEQKIARAMWHYARALAYLAKNEVKKAEQERQELLALQKSIPEDAKISDWNSARQVLDIARGVLDAKLALERNDRRSAIDLLRQAVKSEGSLKYGEPPDWISPVRETLGAVLLLGGDAAEAERVFRAGLEKHPRDGRCLFGLRESLKAQKKDYAARLIDQQFQAAWRNADVKELRLEDF